MLKDLDCVDDVKKVIRKRYDRIGVDLLASNLFVQEFLRGNFTRINTFPGSDTLSVRLLADPLGHMALPGPEVEYLDPWLYKRFDRAKNDFIGCPMRCGPDDCWIHDVCK